jgi:hypothetical protein
LLVTGLSSALRRSAGGVEGAGMSTIAVIPTVEEPAGTAQSFDHGSGHAGSPARQMTATAGHPYAAISGHAVRCSVRGADPPANTRGRATLTTALKIAASPTPSTTTSRHRQRPAAPRCCGRR